MNGRKLMERRHAFTWVPGPLVGVQGNAPDNGGIIGIEDDKVQGVDIQRAKIAWSVTLKGIPFSENYRKYLAGMAFTVNLNPVFGAEAEEILFVGCDISYRPGDGFVGTYSFEEGMNQVNAEVGGFLIPSIKAHDYVWCEYYDQLFAIG